MTLLLDEVFIVCVELILVVVLVVVVVFVLVVLDVLELSLDMVGIVIVSGRQVPLFE